MKRVLLSLFVLSLLQLGLGEARANGDDVDRKLPYSKKTSLAYPATYTLRFSLHDADSAGNEIWSEEKLVKVTSATLKTFLGEIESLDEVEFSQQLWVQVERRKADGTLRLIGVRDKLTIAPYAFWSATSAAGQATDVACESCVSDVDLAANSVGVSEIQVGAVGTSEIADLAVSTADLAAGAVTGAKIASGTVTATNLALNSVAAGQIQASAVGTSEIAELAVTSTKLNLSLLISSVVAAPTSTEVTASLGTRRFCAMFKITSVTTLFGPPECRLGYSSGTWSLTADNGTECQAVCF